MIRGTSVQDTVLSAMKGVSVSKGDIHTVPREDGWANEREGQDRAISKHPTKDQAEKAGRDVARSDKVEHLIHKQDGKIGERNTYRPKDPYPPRG